MTSCRVIAPVSDSLVRCLSRIKICGESPTGPRTVTLIWPRARVATGVIVWRPPPVRRSSDASIIGAVATTVTVGRAARSSRPVPAGPPAKWRTLLQSLRMRNRNERGSMRHGGAKKKQHLRARPSIRLDAPRLCRWKEESPGPTVSGSNTAAERTSVLGHRRPWTGGKRADHRRTNSALFGCVV